MNTSQNDQNTHSW